MKSASRSRLQLGGQEAVSIPSWNGQKRQVSMDEKSPLAKGTSRGNTTNLLHTTNLNTTNLMIPITTNLINRLVSANCTIGASKATIHKFNLGSNLTNKKVTTANSKHRIRKKTTKSLQTLRHEKKSAGVREKLKIALSKYSTRTPLARHRHSFGKLLKTDTIAFPTTNGHSLGLNLVEIRQPRNLGNFRSLKHQITTCTETQMPRNTATFSQKSRKQKKMNADQGASATLKRTQEELDDSGSTAQREKTLKPSQSKSMDSDLDLSVLSIDEEIKKTLGRPLNSTEKEIEGDIPGMSPRTREYLERSIDVVDVEDIEMVDHSPPEWVADKGSTEEYPEDRAYLTIVTPPANTDLECAHTPRTHHAMQNSAGTANAISGERGTRNASAQTSMMLNATTLATPAYYGSIPQQTITLEKRIGKTQLNSSLINKSHTSSVFLDRKRKMDADNSTEQIIACILPKNYPTKAITEELKKNILRNIDETIKVKNGNTTDPTKKLSFLNQCTRAGVIISTCQAAATANFVRLAVEQLNREALQDMPDIHCVPLNKVVFSPAFSYYYPEPNASFDQVRSYIGKCLGIATDKWIELQLIKGSTGSPGTRGNFLGDANIAEKVAADRFGNLRIQFGFSTVIHIKKLHNEFSEGTYKSEHLENVVYCSIHFKARIRKLWRCRTRSKEAFRWRKRLRVQQKSSLPWQPSVTMQTSGNSIGEPQKINFTATSNELRKLYMAFTSDSAIYLPQEEKKNWAMKLPPLELKLKTSTKSKMYRKIKGYGTKYPHIVIIRSFQKMRCKNLKIKNKTKHHVTTHNINCSCSLYHTPRENTYRISTVLASSRTLPRMSPHRRWPRNTDRAVDGVTECWRFRSDAGNYRDTHKSQLTTGSGQSSCKLILPRLLPDGKLRCRWFITTIGQVGQRLAAGWCKRFATSNVHNINCHRPMQSASYFNLSKATRRILILIGGVFHIDYGD